MTFSLDTNDMATIQLIEKMTHAKIRDVIEESPERLVVIVQNGNLAQALGKNASNLKALESKFNKKMRMVEHSEDPLVFLRNLCKPNKVNDIKVEGKTYTIMPADIKSRGFMIGRAASTLRLHEKIMRRYFEVDEIKVEKVE